MAIKQQEKNFLIGITAFSFLIVAVILLLPLLNSSENAEQQDTVADRQKLPVELAEQAATQTPLPSSKPRTETTDEATREPVEKKTDSRPSPVAPTLVLSRAARVPGDYFKDGSGVTSVPQVVERYLKNVKNGARFMGRLEAIALRNLDVREAQRQSLKSAQQLSLQKSKSSKVISYNMKIEKTFLAARFDAEVLDDFKSDILVEWVDAQSNERIELFFSPLKRDGAEGKFQLKMPEDAVPPASNVFVYSATDEMRLIVSGSYTPE